MTTNKMMQVKSTLFLVSTFCCLAGNAFGGITLPPSLFASPAPAPTAAASSNPSGESNANPAAIVAAPSASVNTSRSSFVSACSSKNYVSPGFIRSLSNGEDLKVTTDEKSGLINVEFPKMMSNCLKFQVQKQDVVDNKGEHTYYMSIVLDGGYNQYLSCLKTSGIIDSNGNYVAGAQIAPMGTYTIPVSDDGNVQSGKIKFLYDDAFTIDYQNPNNRDGSAPIGLPNASCMKYTDFPGYADLKIRSEADKLKDEYTLACSKAEKGDITNAIELIKSGKSSEFNYILSLAAQDTIKDKAAKVIKQILEANTADLKNEKNYNKYRTALEEFQRYVLAPKIDRLKELRAKLEGTDASISDEEAQKVAAQIASIQKDLLEFSKAPYFTETLEKKLAESGNTDFALKATIIRLTAQNYADTVGTASEGQVRWAQSFDKTEKDIAEQRDRATSSFEKAAKIARVRQGEETGMSKQVLKQAQTYSKNAQTYQNKLNNSIVSYQNACYQASMCTSPIFCSSIIRKCKEQQAQIQSDYKFYSAKIQKYQQAAQLAASDYQKWVELENEGAQAKIQRKQDAKDAKRKDNDGVYSSYFSNTDINFSGTSAATSNYSSNLDSPFLSTLQSQQGMTGQVGMTQQMQTMNPYQQYSNANIYNQSSYNPYAQMSYGYNAGMSYPYANAYGTGYSPYNQMYNGYNTGYTGSYSPYQYNQYSLMPYGTSNAGYGYGYSPYGGYGMGGIGTSTMSVPTPIAY